MLKQETFEEKRSKNFKNLWLKLIKSQFNLDKKNNNGTNENDISYTLNELVKYGNNKSILNRDDFIGLVHEWYGSSEDETDWEYRLVQFLTVLKIIKKLSNYWQTWKKWNNSFFDCYYIFELDLNNIKRTIQTIFPDYKVDFIQYKYEPIAMKTVIDNIKNVPTKYSELIAELLKPMKTDVELTGLITKIYKNFENMEPNKLLQIANEFDQAIYKRAWNTAKCIANVIVRHKSESKLTVKDIAHNFALNASLCFKMWEMFEVKN